MNNLTEWVLNELVPSKNKITTVIAIYPGRFQPMGAHHAKSYKWLAKKFGDRHTFVGTTNKVALPKSPFNFNEKKKIINSHGIKNVIQVKNPYKAEEILSKYDPDTTAAVFMVGQKDSGRLGGNFFKPWKGKATVGYRDGAYIIHAPHVTMDVPGFGEMSGTQIRKALGSDVSNKQKIFKGIFGHTQSSIYKLVVPKLEKLNETIKKFCNKSKNYKILSEGSYTGASGGGEVDDGPRYFYGSKRAYETDTRKHAERLGMEVVDYVLTNTMDFTSPYPEKGPVPSVSFYPAGVPGETTPTNQDDYKGRPAFSKWKKHIQRVAGGIGYEFVNFLDAEESVDDSRTEPNTKVVATSTVKETFMKNPKEDPKWKNADEDTEEAEVDPLLSKKIDGFVAVTARESVSKEYWKKVFEAISLPVEIGDTVFMGKWKNKKVVVKTIDWNEKGDLLINGMTAMKMRIPTKANVFESSESSLLIEGGAYGHMNHPFDDGNLKFADIKKMIDLGLRGKLDVESAVTEKTDGQNLMVTWRDGKLKASRGSRTIIEPMDISAVKTKFSGRGNIEKAFVYAMKDLEKAIGGLSDKQKNKIFRGGWAYMNLEIIYPPTENVIVYDTAVLQFHGAIEYDKKGKILGPVKDSASMLQGMIAQVNADTQKHFKIVKPQVLSLKPHNDYTKKRDYFFGKLKKLQKEFNLKDNDTLSLYHQAWWESYIRKQSTKYNISSSVVTDLTKRWAFFDKSFRLNKKTISDEKFLKWAIDFDKKSHKDQVKINMLPFETLIFEVGTEILKNVSNYLTASPDKAVQKVKDEIASVAKDIEKGGDLNKLKKLKQQLTKIEQAGGIDKMVPSEGLVFIYGGKTYKITGLFGPVNQILGTLKYA